MKTLLGIFIVTILFSCGNSIEFKESPIPQMKRSFPVSALTFENINEQIIKPNCFQ